MHHHTEVPEVHGGEDAATLCGEPEAASAAVVTDHTDSTPGAVHEQSSVHGDIYSYVYYFAKEQ